MMAKVLRRLVSELSSVIDMFYAKIGTHGTQQKEHPFINGEKWRIEGFRYQAGYFRHNKVASVG
jgi:hypothetical protein